MSANNNALYLITLFKYYICVAKNQWLNIQEHSKSNMINIMTFSVVFKNKDCVSCIEGEKIKPSVHVKSLLFS